MENAPIYQAVTTYDEQAYAMLVHLMSRKLRRWPRYMILGTGLATVLLPAMYMVLQSSVEALPFLAMMFGSLLFTFGLFLDKFTVKMLMAAGGKEPPVNTYRFYADEMVIISGEREQRYSYGYLQRLIEMSGFLFLFAKDGQAYLLRQSDVRGGYAGLKALLEEKVGAARK